MIKVYQDSLNSSFLVITSMASQAERSRSHTKIVLDSARTDMRNRPSNSYSTTIIPFIILQ